jgi:hypothetical protein
MSDDPIHDEQLAIVESLLARTLAAEEYEGFLIIGNRFVDRFGNSRIGNLAGIFQTDSPGWKGSAGGELKTSCEGPRVLSAVLGHVSGYHHPAVTLLPTVPDHRHRENSSRRLSSVEQNEFGHSLHQKYRATSEPTQTFGASC